MEYTTIAELAYDMRNFFTTIYLAISSLDFYKDVSEKSFWKTLGFYALFLILIALLRAIPFIFWSLPQLQTDITQALVELDTHYPQDLVINWDGQKLHSSTNPQPVYYPDSLKKYVAEVEGRSHLAIINTDLTEDTPYLDATYTIRQTDILMSLENGESSRLQLVGLLGENPIQINNSVIERMQPVWEEYKNLFLRVAQVIVPFILYGIFLFQRLSMILMDSILFYFFRKVSGRPWSYLTTVKHGMYFFIAAEFVDIVANFTYPQGAGLFFPLTIWFYFFAITFYSPKKK